MYYLGWAGRGGLLIWAPFGTSFHFAFVAQSRLYLQVFVPENMVGRIIGKGGLVINQIRASTGADVRIVAGEGGHNEATGQTLIIRGSTAQVTLASTSFGRHLARTLCQPIRSSAALRAPCPASCTPGMC